MRSEKEIRDKLDVLNTLEISGFDVFREQKLLQWVLDGASEAVAKPLLADVRAQVCESFDSIENVIAEISRGGVSEAGMHLLWHVVRYRKEVLNKILSEHFR